LKGLQGKSDMLDHFKTDAGIKLVRPVFDDEVMPPEKASHGRSLEKLSDDLVSFMGANGAAADYAQKKRKQMGEPDDEGDEIAFDDTTAAKHLLK
jgi:hypothetical protein